MRHGTTTGYAQHQAHGERPCDACVNAKREYDQRWRSAPERTRKNRQHSRAQGRALQALKQENYNHYRELYEAFLWEIQLADEGADR